MFFLGFLTGSMLCAQDPTVDSGFNRPDTGERECAPTIGVNRTSLDFGEVPIAETAELELVLQNLSEGCTLQLLGQEVEGGEGPFEVLRQSQQLLFSGEGVDIRLGFTPSTTGPFEDLLMVFSEDPANPVLEIPMSGSGVGTELRFVPELMELEATSVGCVLEAYAELFNVGESPGRVDELLLSGDVDALSLEFDELPFALIQGDDEIGLLRFEPPSTGEYSLTAEVTEVFGGSTAQLLVQASAEPLPAITQAWVQAENPRSDVLIAVPDSGSMETQRGRLVGALNAMLDALDASGSDYRVAIVKDSSGCVGINPPYVAAGEDRQVQLTRLEAMLAVPGSGADFHLLERMETALSLTGEGACNAGLRRDDASLALWGVLNGADTSPGSTQHYLDTFAALTPGRLVVHALGGPLPAGCGSANPSFGIAELVDSTGGELLSICDTDYSDELTRMVRLSVTDLERVFLRREPLPETLQVWVGASQESRWSYDPLSWSLRFESAAQASPGETISLSYAPLALPEDCPD